VAGCIEAFDMVSNPAVFAITIIYVPTDEKTRLSGQMLPRVRCKVVAVKGTGHNRHIINNDFAGGVIPTGIDVNGNIRGRRRGSGRTAAGKDHQQRKKRYGN
jgi:hypothetical protein